MDHKKLRLGEHVIVMKIKKEEIGKLFLDYMTIHIFKLFLIYIFIPSVFRKFKLLMLQLCTPQFTESFR